MEAEEVKGRWRNLEDGRGIRGNQRSYKKTEEIRENQIIPKKLSNIILLNLSS